MKPVKLFDLNMGQLPTRLPMLPLAEVMLMPEGKFSVRLTDFRQISLIFEAMGHGRMLGIVQYKNNKNIYSVGCAARISGFNENDDDSLTIQLTGVCRFTVLNQNTENQTCFLNVDYTPFVADFSPESPVNKKSVLYALEVYLKTRHIDIDVDLLERLSTRRLIATLASVLPLEASERQLLLECKDLSTCLDTLQTILKMGAVTTTEKGERKC